MKKVFHIKNLFRMVLVSSMLVALTACEKKIDESIALAPKSMAGKTLKVDGATIDFSSNTSATISNYIGTASRSSVSYKRTSEVTADLSFSYYASDSKSMADRDYTLTLTFADKTQGIASGKYNYRLTIQKGTKYEKNDSGTKTLSNAIFHIYD